MAIATVPEVEPTSFFVGDSLTWKISDADYAPGTWTLKYALVNASAQILITSTSSDGYHLVEVAATTTDDYIPGTYTWYSYVENALATERYNRRTGIVEIKPNYAVKTGGYDARTWTKITLDAIQARLSGNASTAQLSRRVGDLSVQEMSLDQLLDVEAKLKARYEAEVESENLNNGRRQYANKVKTRFVDA
jgi:hypothetical protein